MKSWLSVGGSLMALALFVSQASFAVESANVGGLLKIDSHATNTIVNVPWVGFAENDTTPIDIAALVKTRNLVVGDTVMAVRSNGVYEAWSVDENRAWEQVTTISKIPGAQTLAEAAVASARTLNRGLGLWLVRCGEGANLDLPFYVSGQYAATPENTTVAGSTSGAAAWTLLANPDRTAVTSLNAIDWQEKPLATDEIAVVKNDGAHQIFTWKGGKWGTGGGWGTDPVTGLPKQLKRDTTAEIPAGAAIWYVRKGETFSFSWQPSTH